MTAAPTWLDAPHHGRWRLVLLGGRHQRYGPDWGSGGRPIGSDFARLYLPVAGTGEIRTARAVHALRPGELTLAPPACPARYRAHGPFELAWIHLRIEVLPGIDAWRQGCGPATRPAGREERRRLLRAIRLLAATGPAADLEATALAAGLAAAFLPATWDGLLPEGVERLAPALRLIDEQLDRRLDLPTLAATVHLHPTYFSNLFARTCGEPPLRYLAGRRLARACELLAAGADDIAAVARRCGYRDPLHFSRAFRRRYGLPPSRWRAAQAGMGVACINAPRGDQ